MIDLRLGPKKGALKVLCLGAHSDDIEIGCGGTILWLIGERKDIVVDWVVFGASGKRKNEAATSAKAFLAGAARRTITVEEFKDGYFPFIGTEIKDYFESLKARFAPDLIFTHQRSDLHQDHRLISDLTWNTFRDHLILEYEIPKYDADLGAPNVYFPLNEPVVHRKVRLIMKHFASQAVNHWFTEETFRVALRLRGVESNAPSGYAEGFYGRKLTLG
jgi:LmbE family N-acetylglucosaminyl deacetylase